MQSFNRQQTEKYSINSNNSLWGKLTNYADLLVHIGAAANVFKLFCSLFWKEKSIKSQRYSVHKTKQLSKSAHLRSCKQQMFFFYLNINNKPAVNTTQTVNHNRAEPCYTELRAHVIDSLCKNIDYSSFKFSYLFLKSDCVKENFSM